MLDYKKKIEHTRVRKSEERRAQSETRSSLSSICEYPFVLFMCVFSYGACMIGDCLLVTPRSLWCRWTAHCKGRTYGVFYSMPPTLLSSKTHLTHIYRWIEIETNMELETNWPWSVAQMTNTHECRAKPICMHWCRAVFAYVCAVHATGNYLYIALFSLKIVHKLFWNVPNRQPSSW